MARGGGNVTQVQMPQGNSPWADLMTQIPQLFENLQRQQYMKSLLAQQARAAAAAEEEARGLSDAGSAVIPELQAFASSVGMTAGRPQAQGMGAPSQGVQDAPVGGGYTINTSSADHSGRRVPGSEGQIRVGAQPGAPQPMGVPPQPGAPMGPPSAPPVVQTPHGQMGALMANERARLESFIHSDRELTDTTRALGDATVRSDDPRLRRVGDLKGRRDAVNQGALGVKKELTDAMVRHHKAEGIRGTKELLVDLDPESRKFQEAAIEAAARLAEAGMQDQAIDGILQHTQPSVMQRVSMQRQGAEIKNMTNQSQADTAATPQLLQALAGDPNVPEEQRARLQQLAQIPGLVIWGAGTEMVKYASGNAESARFASNAVLGHNLRMEQIGAQDANIRGGQQSNELLRNAISTIQNRARFGVNGQPVDFQTAYEGTIADLKGVGMLPPEIEGVLRGTDPQVLSDVGAYAPLIEANTDLAEVRRLLAGAGRTPDQIRQTLDMLRGNFVTTGTPTMTR